MTLDTAEAAISFYLQIPFINFMSISVPKGHQKEGIKAFKYTVNICTA